MRSSTTPIAKVQIDSASLAKPRQKAGTRNALLKIKQVGNDKRTSRAKLRCRSSTEPRFFRLMKTHRPLPQSWNLQQPQAYQQTYLDDGARRRSTPFRRVRVVMVWLLQRAQRGRASHLPASALICSAAGGTCLLPAAQRRRASHLSPSGLICSAAGGTYSQALRRSLRRFY
ncbi:hypothetical protein BH10BDE1_BH10BDE1_24010 [soil metagenome]